MEDLAVQHCDHCGGAVHGLSAADITQMLAQVPQWDVVEDGKAIARTLKFANFATALEFVNRVGVLAEAEGHHPDFALGWGYVKLTLTTHDAGGITANDFIMAAKINALI